MKSAGVNENNQILGLFLRQWVVLFWTLIKLQKRDSFFGDLFSKSFATLKFETCFLQSVQI